jgi:hypothetical protein
VILGLATQKDCGLTQRSCFRTTNTDLSEEERQQIFSAADFGQFVEHSSKIIQRALSDAYDYTTDYRIDLDTAMLVKI